MLIIECLAMLEESGWVLLIAVDLSKKTTIGVSIIFFEPGILRYVGSVTAVQAFFGNGVCPFHLGRGENPLEPTPG